MPDLPSISVITPTLNQAPTLPQTLASVWEQDPPPHEHLVLDALSHDETPAILEEARLRHPGLRIFREADEGQSDAIDKGIRRATGEIVGWLNSDDYLLPGALRAVAETFARHPHAPLVYGGGRKVAFDGETLKSVRARPFDRRLLRRAFYFIQPAMFFRREAYLQCGGLDRRLAYAMDWDLVLKLARYGDFVPIDAELAALRCYETTKSSTGGWKRAAEIATIGRRHHGLRDPNYLVFLSKSLTALLLPRALHPRVDGLIHAVLRSPGPMVEGWPPAPQSVNSPSVRP